MVFVYYSEYLAQIELYNNDYVFKYKYMTKLLFVNFVLLILSVDDNINKCVFLLMYFINIVEFYVNCNIFQRVLNISEYLLLLCLHIILLYFFFDDTSYISSIIYMTSCLIIGIM